MTGIYSKWAGESSDLSLQVLYWRLFLFFLLTFRGVGAGAIMSLPVFYESTSSLCFHVPLF